MTLILSGTDGVSDIDGTAATPAIRGTDANTGIFFPAADTIAFTEGGAEAMRIDSSGTVMIGTSTNAGGRRLNVVGRIAATNSDAVDNQLLIGADAGEAFVAATYASNGSYQPLTFYTSATERMRITSGGNLRIGLTSTLSGYRLAMSGGSLWMLDANKTLTGGGNILMYASDSQAADIGPSIGFGGYYIGTASDTEWAQIAGRKENGTSGNYAGYLQFSTRANGGNVTERMRIDSSGNVLVRNNAADNNYFQLQGSQGELTLYPPRTGKDFGVLSADTGAGIIFETNGGVERARITSDGVFAVGKTSTDSNTVGASMRTDGYCTMTRSANKCLDVNRQTNDGTLVSFLQDNTEEGSISVSGNTVSYNAFTGGHWSQLQQGRGYNPEILRGTVMSSIGEMCEWKSVVWDEVIEHPAVLAVEAKEAVVDEEGNVVEPAVEAVEGKDAWTETINKREAYLGNLAVGATFTEDGVTKTVVDDGNERLPKVKISDVVGDKAVYGVFQTYDEVQDMLVTSLGAFVVRIAAGVTVQIGDLLESNGDGCAKVQDDDVIRSKTIGKVTSTTPSATYADGSYTVPCVIYCG